MLGSTRRCGPLLGAAWAALALTPSSGRAQAEGERPTPDVVGDTARLTVTRPTVVAYLVVPPGAVDADSDLAVVADDWSYAMATLGDSFEAHGVAFALVTERRLRVGAAGTRAVLLTLDRDPATGYVFARPGEAPCMRRGPAAPDTVLAAARSYFGGGKRLVRRARAGCDLLGR